VRPWQSARGLPVTELPGLRTSLTLLGLEPERALTAYADRLDLEASPAGGGHGAGMDMGGMDMGGMDMGGAQEAAEPMDHGKMGMEEEDEGASPPTVHGDPAEPKTLTLMAMREMVMDNEHTRAVRAARELVGAVQIKLAEGGFYAGTIDGFPDTGRMREAVSAYQRASGLKPTGEHDIATALVMLGLERGRVEASLGSRLELDHSPVAPDRELMEKSSRRF
jgi:hypothetical protein